jgi:hypothetical protein
VGKSSLTEEKSGFAPLDKPSRFFYNGKKEVRESADENEFSAGLPEC